MSTRYKKLLSFEKPLWAEGSPLIINKGALLADTVRGQNLLQLKLTNVQARPLSAVILGLELADVKGDSLESVEHSYLDLNVKAGESFGEDVPIWLADETARSYRFSVSTVKFADGGVWTGSPIAEEIGEPEWLDSLGSLKDQFLREISHQNTSVVPQVLPTESGGLWYCTCGAVNAASSIECHSCGLGWSDQHAVSERGYLEARSAAHLEQQRLEEEKAARKLEEARRSEAAKAEKTRKMSAIAAVIVLLAVAAAVLVTQVALPTVEYNAAIAELNAGDYREAATAFRGLGTFRDSERMHYKSRIEGARQSIEQGEDATSELWALHQDLTRVVTSSDFDGDDDSFLLYWDASLLLGRVLSADDASPVYERMIRNAERLQNQIEVGDRLEEVKRLLAEAQG